MKQWRIDGDWNFDGLAMVDADVPEPGPGEVLLRMKAVSLNYRDHVMVGRGYGRLSGELPLVPLSDGVGEVVAMGDGVEDIAIGARRVPCFNQDWMAGDFEDAMWGAMLGGPVDGTAREYMCAKAAATVAVPDHLTDEEAATLCCAAITGWNSVAEMPASAVDGGTVVTQGTGGVSLFALQFAKSKGARVIATSSSAEKLARLTALGADEVIDYRDVPEWGKAVLALTDGRGADLVVDIGGAATFNQSLRATRADGVIALVGNVTGAVVEVNLALVFMFRKRLIGMSTGSVADFDAMMAHIADTGLRPVLDDRVREFDGLKDALQAFPRGEHFGKVVIRVD
jgi:NADPH:quinone reductase-like Zn-dependent oxidoreductase